MICPIVLEYDRLLTNIGLPISVHSNEEATQSLHVSRENKTLSVTNSL